MTEAAENPYAAPTAIVDRARSILADVDMERVRREHLNTEQSLRSLGGLYIMGAIFWAFGLLGVLVSGNEKGAMELFGVLVVVVGMSAGSLALGVGLRRLHPTARSAGIGMSVLGLLAFPIGTLINSYVLYLFLSAKGKLVFSPQYKDIIAHTPHVTGKTSIVVWLLVGILVMVFLSGVVAAIAG